MKIIGIDPGTTTGIALCEANVSKGTFGINEAAEITGVDGLEERYGEGAAADDKAWRWLEYYNALECYGWIDSFRPDLVVIEDFILQPGKQGEYRGGARAGLSPARIGAVLGTFIEVAYEHEGLTLMWQGSSLISRMNKVRMDRLGLWVPASEHKRDAVRHAYVGYGRHMEGKSTRPVKKAAKKAAGAKKVGRRGTVKKAVGARKQGSSSGVRRASKSARKG